MSDSIASYENDFFEWLAKRVPSTRMPVIHSVFKRIDRFCLKRKILAKPIFGTDDLATLTGAIETIRGSRILSLKYRKQKSIMVAAIQQYCRFIQEIEDNKSSVEPECMSKDSSKKSEQETAESGSLVDFLTANNISFIDNRQKNGCLWIIGGKELKEFVDKCSIRGVRFHFKADGSRATHYSPAWWTTGDFSSSVKSESVVQSVEEVPTDKPYSTAISNENNQSLFTEWLHGRGVLPNDISVILSSLKRCEERVKAEKLIEDDIYHITSAETISAVRSFLLADRNFIYADSRKANRFTNALALYSEFFNEQLAPIAEVSENLRVETDPSVKADAATVSEIDTLLSDEDFLPLRQALAKENIRTIEQLKSLKLWAFMNEKDVYPISMRHSVFAKVSWLLEPETAERPTPLYELRCGPTVYSGDTPAKAFSHFCEEIAKKNPLFFRSLLDKTIGTHSNVKIYRSPESDDFIKIEEPTSYVCADLTKDSVLDAVEWITQRCIGTPIAVSIEGPYTHAARASSVEVPHGLAENETDKKQQDGGNVGQVSQVAFDNVRVISLPSTSSREKESGESEMIARIEKIVLDADLSGVTYDDLYNTLNMPMVAIKGLVWRCRHIVEIKGKLYHEDAFVDWDDGAKQLSLIMEKLMQKNNGYISAVQLYDYARAEMNLFLNDNDMNEERCVYEIAQHLFEKNRFEDKHYSFINKAHISSTENTIGSNFDVICKYAEEQGGVFQEGDLSEYLKTIGIKTGNLRMQMRLGQEAKFFFYEPGTIISAKSMRIDNSWKESVGRALGKLFNDVGDYIILRQIQPIWFESLPALPGRRPWTPLLLQYVLIFYGGEWGAKTIAALKSQSMDTLHAMLVKADGPIQNFGDAVVACLVDSGTEQRSFEAEELRQFLVRTGMVQGNELIYNMPKALAKDERFAWDAKGEHVTIRV